MPMKNTEISFLFPVFEIRLPRLGIVAPPETSTATRKTTS